MVKAADLGDLDDPTCARWLRRPRDRGVLVEGEVRAPLMVIGHVPAKVAAQPLFVPDDDVVEAFAARRQLAPRRAGDAFRKELLLT